MLSKLIPDLNEEMIRGLIKLQHPKFILTNLTTSLGRDTLKTKLVYDIHIQELF